MAEESTAKAPLERPEGEPEAPPDPISEPELEQALVGAAKAKRRRRRSPTVFHGVDPKRVFNPSEMPKKRGLIVRAFSHMLFKRVAFDESHMQTIRDSAREGDVVFAMNHHSVLDYLYFTYAFTRFGLAASRQRSVLTGQLLYQVEPGLYRFEQRSRQKSGL